LLSLMPRSQVISAAMAWIWYPKTIFTFVRQKSWKWMTQSDSRHNSCIYNFIFFGIIHAGRKVVGGQWSLNQAEKLL
jgi:hypothetical protein